MRRLALVCLVLTLGAAGTEALAAPMAVAEAPLSTVTVAAAPLRTMPAATAGHAAHRRPGPAAPPVRHLFDFTPDDPYFAKQSAYLDAVRAPAAWARQRGSATVVIAIIDSGIDVNHPDLKSKIIGTYNTINPSSTSIADPIGHGTFVAGIAAADTDNRIGVAGVGVRTKLLGVKVAGADHNVSIANEIVGIRWAADHGADIVNLSLGGPDYNRGEADAVAYAQAKGALVVAAAGNDSSTAKQYPAAYPGVVAVAATDPSTHTRATFSGHGSWVSVAAPGVGIVSTTPHKGSRFFGARSYATSSGTSFAAPIVAGEAALLKAGNPSLSVAALRSAVIASAHGYAHLGLGAGQVDFSRGLAHLRPATRPRSLHESGSADDVAVRADSRAPAVSFRIDSGPWGAAVPVHGAAARTTLDTDGYANGPHIVSARDCTVYSECNSRSTSTPLMLNNAAGDIVSPADESHVTGLVAIDADRPTGGTLRLLVDGTPRDRLTDAPYRFHVSASDLSDGLHTLRVQLCSADHTRCDGPISRAVHVSSTALRPGRPSAAEDRISPNGDADHDTTTWHYSLPDTESVQVHVLDRAGTLVALDELGTLRAGRHSWRWRGFGGDGTVLRDGRYTLALSTSRGDVRGWVSTTGVVDTSAPRISSPPAAAVLYPYPDHYRDVLRPNVNLGGAGTLTLEVVDAAGDLVHRVVAEHHAGTSETAWNGTDGTGHRVPAGRYTYRLTITDSAGNSRSTNARPVQVSNARLRQRVITVTQKANNHEGSGASSSCTRVDAGTSALPAGVLFTNRCPADAHDLAYAQYAFTVPTVVRYTRITVGFFGRVGSNRSELTTSLQRADGTVEVRAHRTVNPGRAAWHTIASVAARGHVRGHGHVYASIALTDNYAGRNSVDAARVRLRLRGLVLS